MAAPELVLVAHYDSDGLSELRRLVEEEGFRVQATTSGPDVLKRAESARPDAIVLDPMLQRTNGLAVLKSLKDDPTLAGIPVVMLTDDGDTYTEGRATSSGADALVRRGADGTLPATTLGAKLRALLAARALKSASRKESLSGTPLERLLLATPETVHAENPLLGHLTDPLTGLFNAAYFDLKLSEEFKRSRRFHVPMTLIFLKLIPDSPDAADEKTAMWRQVLNEVAGVLLCECRDIDILGRVDAQSFSLLLPHTDAKGATTMASRVLGHAPKEFGSGDKAFTLRTAVGLFTFDGDPSDGKSPDGRGGIDGPEELRRRAKTALGAAVRRPSDPLVEWSIELDADKN